jgi:hypothetical protein
MFRRSVARLAGLALLAGVACHGSRSDDPTGTSQAAITSDPSTVTATYSSLEELMGTSFVVPDQTPAVAQPAPPPGPNLDSAPGPTVPEPPVILPERASRCAAEHPISEAEITALSRASRKPPLQRLQPDPGPPPIPAEVASQVAAARQKFADLVAQNHDRLAALPDDQRQLEVAALKRSAYGY